MSKERTPEEVIAYCSNRGEWTEDEIFGYYQECFKSIYADLVSVTANKPNEISFETDAMLSHLGVAKTNTDPDIVASNILKAGGHLERASLDAAKILWLTYHRQLQPVVTDRHIRKYCILIPEHEFIAKYNEVTTLAQKARAMEIENVGISPRESVIHYYKAANEFRNLLNLVDGDRTESFKKFRLAYIVKKQSVGFLVGLIAGLISSAIIAILVWKYLPPQDTNNTIDKPSVNNPAPEQSKQPTNLDAKNK